MWVLVNSEQALVKSDRVLVNTDQVLVKPEQVLVKFEWNLVRSDRVLVNNEQVLLKSEGILVKVQVLVNSPAADLTLYNCIFWFCCQEDGCRKSSPLWGRKQKMHSGDKMLQELPFHFIFCFFLFVYKVTQAMLWHHQYKKSTIGSQLDFKEVILAHLFEFRAELKFRYFSLINAIW